MMHEKVWKAMYAEYEGLLTKIEEAARKKKYVQLAQLAAQIEGFQHAMEVVKNIPGPRVKVQRFADEMERQLRANDYKGGWSQCTTKWLLGRLEQEKRELARALNAYHQASKGMSDGARRASDRVQKARRAIAHEAADVANVAMMITDVLGGLVEP